MKINRENIDNVNAVIKVLIEKNDYEKNVADKLREYRQKVALPGFRPGKVPAGIINKRFGKALLAEEVNQLLTQNLTNYLRDEKISIIGDPLPNDDLQQPIDFDNNQDFEFVFDIALTPEINLELNKDRSIDYYKIKVDDQMIGENIEQIRSQFGANADTESVSANSYVRIDLRELNPDGTEKEEGIHAENVLMAVDLIKDESVRNLIIGKSLNDEVVFNPVTAFQDRHEVSHFLNISHEDAETLESEFRAVIRTVQDFQNAELNEELYKKLFGEETEVTTEEQFREKLSENISVSLENTSKQRFEFDARKALVDSVSVELPEAFLKRWLKETNKELAEDKLEEDFPDFLEDLKWQLIKNAIIRENEINVSEEETFSMAKSVAMSQYQQYGIYNIGDEHLESFAHKILEREEDRERIVRRIFELKVYDIVREKVNLNEKEITADEFKAL